MSNKNLFQEAIADAKAVREAALANAKAALEETMTPRLQSMLDAKLNEYADENDDNMEEGFEDQVNELDSDLEEELDLEAILAELEGDDTLEEAKDKDKDKEKEDKEAEKKKMNEAEDEAEEDEDEEDKSEKKLKDMDKGELKDFITDLVKDILADEKAEEAGEEAEDMAPEMDSTEEDEVEVMDEDIDINELLAELDSLNENEMYEEEKEKPELKEGDVSTLLAILYTLGLSGTLINQVAAQLKGKSKEEQEQIVQKVQDTVNMKKGLEESDELEEAIETINVLRNELNEVNLLNAKLLYVNKIFKAKNLSESQKLNVIAAFDKATNVKEAKLVFESLNESISAASAKKNQIKESIGFASKAAGVAPKQQIIESNDVISRMQKLANIK